MRYFFTIACLLFLGKISLAQAPLEVQTDFEVTEIPMAEALVQLGKKAGVPISFSDNILPKNKKVTLSVRNQKVKTILTTILVNTDVQFQAVGSQIVLFYKKTPRKKFTISGFIKDLDSGEKLYAANVYDKKSGKGTSTNEYGFYSLSLFENNVELVVSYLGFDPQVHHLNLSKNSDINFDLRPNLTLREIIVTPIKPEKVDLTEPISVDKISVLQMNKLPSFGGEPDVFRMAELMPGVQSGSDGLGGLHVRGGSADQNLILMDGVPIYNPSHALGIFSVFNTEAIQSMQLYKGGFPARFGGRLSSIMDVRTREGNQKRWSGSVKAGLIAGNVRIEGPIVKDKASILITARRSLLDNIIENQTRKRKENDDFFQETYGVPLQGFSKYNFYDLNAKLNFSIKKRDKFFFSYYTGADEFDDEDRIENAPNEGYTYSDTETQAFNWGNQIGVFRWNHLFGNKLFLNTTLTHSITKFDLSQSLEINIVPEQPNDPINYFGAQAYFTTLKDWGARLDFDYNSSKNHQLRFGANSTLHTFFPGAFGTNVKLDNEIIFEVDLDSFINVAKTTAYEHNIYFEDEFLVGKKLKINAGILGNMFVAEDDTFTNIQPRLSLNYQIVKKLQLQAGISRMVQSLHLVTDSDAGFPNDLWLPATRLITPQTSWQSVLGVQYQPNKSYFFSLEGYYKKLNNLVVYLESSSLREDISNPSNFAFEPINAENWESKVTVGEGWNYGLEFQFKKNIGRTTGWLSYSWAFADRRFEEINLEQRFPYRYDRRHNFNISFVHRFTKWMDFSAKWIYGTGLSTLVPVSTSEVGGFIVFNYDFIRMPANHRLDAGLNFYYNTGKLKHQFYLGGYNLYNRANPQYYQLKTSLKEGSTINNPEFDYKFYQGTFLPFLPSVSYSISF